MRCTPAPGASTLAATVSFAGAVARGVNAACGSPYTIGMRRTGWCCVAQTTAQIMDVGLAAFPAPRCIQPQRQHGCRHSLVRSGNGNLMCTLTDVNVERGVAVESVSVWHFANTSNCRVRRLPAGGVIAIVDISGRCYFGGNGSRPTTSASARPTSGCCASLVLSRARLSPVQSGLVTVQRPRLTGTRAPTLPAPRAAEESGRSGTSTKRHERDYSVVTSATARNATKVSASVTVVQRRHAAWAERHT